MNRAQRRAAQHKRDQRSRTPGRWRAGLTSSLATIARTQPMAPEDIASASNEVRMAWHRITQGDGTPSDFDRLADAMNMAAILSEPIGADALEAAERAQVALLAMQARYHRLGRLGPDADALRELPVGLDLYDQLLTLCSPLQLAAALTEATARAQRAMDRGTA